jgi:phosphatidylglycerophosphate synthase
MLSQLRSAINPLKSALAGPLARANVDPNHVTLAAIPLSLTAFALGASGHYWLALIPAVPAAMADFLDGAVAQLQGRESPEGNFLEAVIDRMVDGLLLGGLCFAYPALCMLAVTFSFCISYTKARVGLVVSSDNSDWPGMGDRSDRLALTALAFIGAGFSHVWGQRALMLLVAMGVIGTVQRLRHGLTLVRKAREDGTLLPYLQG